jgi:hypothetical protein
MSHAMKRAALLVLPWLAVIAITVTAAYGMTSAVTNGVSAAAPTNAPVQVETAHTGNIGAWTTQVGPNCWLPDPSGLEPCASGTPAVDH